MDSNIEIKLVPGSSNILLAGHPPHEAIIVSYRAGFYVEESLVGYCLVHIPFNPSGDVVVYEFRDLLEEALNNE